MSKVELKRKDNLKPLQQGDFVAYGTNVGLVFEIGAEGLDIVGRGPHVLWNDGRITQLSSSAFTASQRFTGTIEVS